MKKILMLTLALVMALGLAACNSDEGQDTGGTADVTEVEMQYIAPADVLAALQNGDDSYLLVDVRKAADHEAGHILTAISADMDAAKEGDHDAGIETMKASLKEATGSETGGDKKLVLICYSGKSYAQAATNVLGAIGANTGNVYTLEGGMTAWGESDGAAAVTAGESVSEVGMQYITADELKSAIDNGDDSYLIVDVRKAADHETSHIPGSVSVDMDAAKEGDTAKGLADMKLGLLKATGSVDGGDKKLVLVCYSGKSYAQASTNVLAAMGVDTGARVLTLEGGFTNWSETYPDAVE